MMKPKLPRQDHIHCYECGKEIRFVWDGTRVRITSYERGYGEGNWTTEERWYCLNHKFSSYEKR